MIFGSDRKKTAEKSHVSKESGVTTRGKREVEVGTLLLGNDKENVITDKILSCFFFLDFRNAKACQLDQEEIKVPA